jgi:hypothetical protein
VFSVSSTLDRTARVIDMPPHLLIVNRITNVSGAELSSGHRGLASGLADRSVL